MAALQIVGPGPVNFEWHIYRGDGYTDTWTYKSGGVGVDISLDTIVLNFRDRIDGKLLLSIDSSGAKIDAQADGDIVFAIPGTDWASLTASGRFDLERQVSGGQPETLAFGPYKLVKDLS